MGQGRPVTERARLILDALSDLRIHPEVRGTVEWETGVWST